MQIDLPVKRGLGLQGGWQPSIEFVALLIGTVLLVGLLNYVPALALGPVVEHLQLWMAH